MKRVTGAIALLLTLGLDLLAAPPPAAAQQTGKVARTGLSLSTSRSPTRSPILRAFRQGLRDLGWVEGQNFVMQYRLAEAKYDRLPYLAAELVRLKVDVIVAPASQAVSAAKQATRTIPIVMLTAGDPVGSGFVPSLARPGGNITGLSDVSPESRT